MWHYPVIGNDFIFFFRLKNDMKIFQMNFVHIDVDKQKWKISFECHLSANGAEWTEYKRKRNMENNSTIHRWNIHLYYCLMRKKRTFSGDIGDANSFPTPNYSKSMSNFVFLFESLKWSSEQLKSISPKLPGTKWWIVGPEIDVSYKMFGVLSNGVWSSRIMILYELRVFFKSNEFSQYQCLWINELHHETNEFWCIYWEFFQNRIDLNLSSNIFYFYISLYYF